MKRLEWRPHVLTAVTEGLRVRQSALLHNWRWVLGLDAAIVAVAFEAAVALRFIDSPLFPHQMATFLAPSLLVGVLYAVVSALLGLHRRAWRYASVGDGMALVRAVMVMTLILGVVDLAFGRLPFAGQDGVRPLPLSVIFGGASLSFLFMGGFKVLPKVMSLHTNANPSSARVDVTRVLILGAGDAGVTLAARFAVNHGRGYQVVGFMDDDPAKWHSTVHGVCVLGPTSAVPEMAAQLDVDLLAIAMPSVPATRIGEIIAVCQRTSASIKILPGLNEVVGRKPQGLHLRELDVADLLGREVVPLRAPEIEDFVRGSVVMVTGAAGSIGSELCRQLVTYEPRKIVALDNNETGLFELSASVASDAERERLQTEICDIADTENVASLLRSHRPDAVFHAAAYKHVPLLEQHPAQAVRINVLSTYRLCRLARENDVGVFVFISSDKAAEPVNVLGASKRLGEKIVQAMAAASEGKTRYCAVRFGNVIGSRGSVVPTFMHQIEKGGPVTVTHPEATRYFMTIPEACGLVILTSTIRDDGGLYLLDMGDPVRIAELAAKMIRLRGLRVERDVPVVYTGLRAGERLHEVLVGPHEALLPASHPQILRVADSEPPQQIEAVEAWIEALRSSLRELEGSELREALLRLAREGRFGHADPIPVASSS
ncbi:MAG: polysaccharide biosynthesis protein [Candidatus Nephthysia bennettiae]|nr:MAG: polysaccharide biosynthesis protein [Candidatus Dormibacteraeota bacterium]